MINDFMKCKVSWLTALLRIVLLVSDLIIDWTLHYVLTALKWVLSFFIAIKSLYNKNGSFQEWFMFK